MIAKTVASTLGQSKRASSFGTAAIAAWSLHVNNTDAEIVKKLSLQLKTLMAGRLLNVEAAGVITPEELENESVVPLTLGSRPWPSKEGMTLGALTDSEAFIEAFLSKSLASKWAIARTRVVRLQDDQLKTLFTWAKEPKLLGRCKGEEITGIQVCGENIQKQVQDALALTGLATGAKNIRVIPQKDDALGLGDLRHGEQLGMHALQNMRTFACNYEKLDAKDMLRVPFTRNPSTKDSTSPTAAPHRSGRAGDVSSWSAGNFGPIDPWRLEENVEDRDLYELQQMPALRRRHVQLARRAARQFQSYDSFARVSMAFGTHQLMQAICYYCLGYVALQDGSPWASVGVLILMCVMTISLVQLDFEMSPKETQHVITPVVTAVNAGILEVEDESEEEEFNLASCREGLQNPSGEMSSKDADFGHASFMKGDEDIVSGHDKIDSGKYPAQIFRTATLLMVLLWVIGLAVPFGVFREFLTKPLKIDLTVGTEKGEEEIEAVVGTSPNGLPELIPISRHRKDLHSLLKGRRVEVQWPSVALRPRTLSCDPSGSLLVVADDLAVYAGRVEGVDDTTKVTFDQHLPMTLPASHVDLDDLDPVSDDEVPPDENDDAMGTTMLSGVDGLDGSASDLRVELAVPQEVEDIPAPLLVEADAQLDMSQHALEMDYDDEVLQIGELTDPWIDPDHAEQDARMEKAFGITDGSGLSFLHLSGQTAVTLCRGFGRVRLERTKAGLRWEDPDAHVALEMSDADVLAALCPQRETAPSFRASAPLWPQVVSQQMGAWPLKGPGTILFDVEQLLQVAGELQDGTGPVLIPGGAQQLKLSSRDVVDLLFPCLMGSSLPDVFDGRVVTLESKPFNMLQMPRRWSRGAVIRQVGRNGVAEQAGCKAGDIIVTINGEAVLNATLQRIQELLDEELPVRLEVGQPVLKEPIYIREATTELLTTLADEEATEAVEDLLPQISATPRPWCKCATWCMGSRSSVWTAAARQGGGSSSTDAEVALPVDIDLDQEHAAWLASPSTSIAMCRAGDVMLFWGGNPHFGSNGMNAGPCAAEGLHKSCRTCQAENEVKKDYVRGFKRSGVYAMDWAGQPLVRPPLVRPAGPVKPEVTSSWSQRKKVLAFVCTTSKEVRRSGRGLESG
eukprot:g20666.t1